MRGFILLLLSASLFAMGGPGKMGMEMGGKMTGAGMQHQNFTQRQQMFRYFDANGDGKISYFEWEERRQNRMQERAKEGKRLKNAGRVRFEDIDTNRDGFIDRAEMRSFQRKRGR